MPIVFQALSMRTLCLAAVRLCWHSASHCAFIYLQPLSRCAAAVSRSPRTVSVSQSARLSLLARGARASSAGARLRLPSPSHLHPASDGRRPETQRRCPMGELRDRMEGDLLLRGVAEVTRKEYLRCARAFAAHYRISPAELGAKEVRDYLLHLDSRPPLQPRQPQDARRRPQVPLRHHSRSPRCRRAHPLPEGPPHPARHPEPRRGGQGARCRALAQVPRAPLLRLRSGTARQRGVQALDR